MTQEIETDALESLEDNFDLEMKKFIISDGATSNLFRVTENWIWKKKTKISKILQTRILLSIEISTYFERFTSDFKTTEENENEIIPENVQIVQCMGVWDDMLYSNNKNRVYELSDDLSSYIVRLAAKAEKLDSLLTILHQNWK
ncbi:27541_t:CDS:1 [Dentiscutata erythropus]|uniref:27541_t:CDS:1 n=1 Tax=Dentiscutata erythropus TaxID=1348616 RepID=A0A9N9HT02_9GLOM|nr:27541_t:CDS:1 [Dentiscutata erythropus]